MVTKVNTFRLLKGNTKFYKESICSVTNGDLRDPRRVRGGFDELESEDRRLVLVPQDSPRQAMQIEATGGGIPGGQGLLSKHAVPTRGVVVRPGNNQEVRFANPRKELSRPWRSV
ncbi:MAG: hypothetical protein QOJ42_5578 [Acidobacteriaceae bacterium]|nr:hypothetical protein [Acidobacteriaceae bacterium]MEA3006608.1 hypothetical protein [Acidobacteriaceae bacterium]